MSPSTPVFAVGCDVETTGLDIDTISLLEVALVTFDADLNPLDSTSVVIRHDVDSLDLNDFVRNMHTENGLLDKVAASTTDLRSAENYLLSWWSGAVKTADDKKPYMLGSSITYDRMVLEKFMPKLHDQFHYRSLDATTVKLLAEVHGPEVEDISGSDHRAEGDILRSAGNLRAKFIEPMHRLRALESQHGVPTSSPKNRTRSTSTRSRQ